MENNYYKRVIEKVSKAFIEHEQAQSSLIGALKNVSKNTSDHDKEDIKKLQILLDRIISTSSSQGDSLVLKQAQKVKLWLERLQSAQQEKGQQKKQETNKHDNIPRSSGLGVKQSEAVMEVEQKKAPSKNSHQINNKIIVSALGMQSFEQLVELAKSAEREKKIDNLVNILRRLKISKVTKEKLKATEAGKFVAKLKKHESPQVSALARGVVEIWKQCLSKSLKTPVDSRAGMKGCPNEKFKRLKKNKDDTKLGNDKRKTAPVERRMEDLKKRKASVPSMSQEEWEQEYLRNARKSYARYQAEENLSTQIGEEEDLRALEEDGY